MTLEERKKAFSLFSLFRQQVKARDSLNQNSASELLDSLANNQPL